ncbi:MAG TPA: NAD(P)H-dependent oxidoreductase [Caulobacteraceae bacterium]|jgi:NAD(P)H dehydrogenase (quinone)
MKHAVIVAHPDASSLNLTLAHAYQAAATRQGDTVVWRDLYRMNFDPRLQSDEIPRAGSPGVKADAVAERAAIGDADVLVFVYPLWFNAQPAMLKGYIDRVFGAGFGFQAGAHGAEPLLGGRMMLSITTSGAPQSWMQETGTWQAVRKLFDDHFAAVCGLSVIDHLHFGGITANITPEAVQGHVDTVSAAVQRHFARAVA